MGTVADGNKVYNNNPSPSAEEGLLMLRENQEAFKETFGVMPPEVLVIKDGAISPTTAICNVRAEGDASADDITTITPTLSNGTTLHDGMVLLLSAKDASQRITLKNSSGQNGIVTTDGKDIILSTKWYVILQFVESKWNQIYMNAPLPIASSTLLGGVKVQTGDNDGLEMIGDKLRVRQANATQRGSVLASETAKAGAAPLGGSDGKLDESWVPTPPVTLFNSRLVITESNAAWTPPVTGWARVTVIGGGGGGNIGSGDNGTAYGGGGGAGGEIVTDYVYLEKSTSYPVVIGAGGTKGSVWATGGAAGGQSSFGTIVAKGGNPAIAAFGGKGSLYSPSGTNSQYNSYPGGGGDICGLGGTGGGSGYGRGGDGAMGCMHGGTDNKHTDGTQGCIIVEYYDPDKEAE